jgi:hypothetical protein
MEPQVFDSFWPFWRAEMRRTLSQLRSLLILPVRWLWLSCYLRDDAAERMTKRQAARINRAFDGIQAVKPDAGVLQQPSVSDARPSTISAPGALMRIYFDGSMNVYMVRIGNVSVGPYGTISEIEAAYPAEFADGLRASSRRAGTP